MKKIDIILLGIALILGILILLRSPLRFKRVEKNGIITITDRITGAQRIEVTVPKLKSNLNKER